MAAFQYLDLVHRWCTTTERPGAPGWTRPALGRTASRASATPRLTTIRKRGARWELSNSLWLLRSTISRSVGARSCSQTWPALRGLRRPAWRRRQARPPMRGSPPTGTFTTWEGPSTWWWRPPGRGRRPRGLPWDSRACSRKWWPGWSRETLLSPWWSALVSRTRMGARAGKNFFSFSVPSSL